MRENYRKPIASKRKLPQFITMNVIDGQAGLVFYSSLIFYSLTIDNILNIIILLILAGISISSLTGSGLFQKAQDTVNRYGNAQKKENSILGEYENYIDNLGNGGNGGSLPSTEETTPYMPDDQSKVIENSDLDTGLVVSDKNNNEWVWIVVPKSETKDATTDLEIETALQNYAGVYREGAKDQGYNWTDEWYDGEGKKYTETSNENDRSGCGLTYTEYNETKSKMLQSIKANGGFWISRYEAGIEESVQNPDLARTSKGEITDSSPKAVSKPDHIPYNYVTCSQAQSLTSKMTPDESKTSSLLFGIQWDLVCRYLDGKDGLTTADINEGSTNWGNYNNNVLNITSAKAMGAGYNPPTYKLGEWQKITEKPIDSTVFLTTGASTKTKKMNIYDFAGNEYEWTLEKAFEGLYSCANRDGCADCDSLAYPPSNRSCISTSFGDEQVSFRASLY